MCFNFGRGMSMLSPFLIGAVADAQGLTAGLMVTAAFNVVGIIAVLFLPETARLAGRKSSAAGASIQDAGVLGEEQSGVAGREPQDRRHTS